MSDLRPDDLDSRVFRRSVLGLPIGRYGKLSGEGSLAVTAPGRGWLEATVVLAAVAILLPVLSVPAVVAGFRARRAGNPRWLAGLLASVWCGLLGILLRAALGATLVP
jgi:hypothetical protein